MGQGEAGRFTGRQSAGLLLKCFLRANLAALAGLPRMLAKRREVARIRRLSSAEVRTLLLRRFRIRLRDLTLNAS